MPDAADSQPITIVGGGLAGTFLAARLVRQGWPVRLIEAQRWDEAPPPQRDLRTLALSRSSWQSLAPLGVTPAALQASVIRRIHVSYRGRPGRVLLDAHDEGLDCFGYTVPYGTLLQALRGALKDRPGLELCDGCQVLAVGGSAVSARVRWRMHGGGACSGFAALLVVADGGTAPSAASAPGAHAVSAGPDPRPPLSFGGAAAELTWHYRQHALVCQVDTDLGSNDLAFERFTVQGPLALLPAQSGFALIWSAPPARIDTLMACDEPAFLQALQDWFGDRAGRFVRASVRLRVPLTARFRLGPSQRRMVRIANAAQTLHPVAGQGFNLGLRDAGVLAGLLEGATGADPGAPVLLDEYRRRRGRDRAVTSGLTHLLAETFALPLPGLGAGSALGFCLLDASPWLRSGFARLMGGGLRP